MLYLLRKLTDNQETLKTIYYSLVQPYFDCCDEIEEIDCSKTHVDELQKLQIRAARIIARTDYSFKSSEVLTFLERSNLEERKKRHLLTVILSDV